MSNSQEHTFDLNLPYVYEESDGDREESMSVFSHVHQISTPSLIEDGQIPMIIHSSSRGNLMIDLNVEHDEEIDIPLMELDVQQLYEDDDDDIANADIEPPNSGIFQEVRTSNRKKNLPNDQRWKIYNALLVRSIDGKLKRDTTTKEVSELFGVSIRTVRRIWRRAKDTSNAGTVDVSHRRTKNCGRKRVEIGLTQITNIPLQRRTTLRSLAIALGVSSATLHRRLKGGLLRRHFNAIKPLLRDENKLARLKFCIAMLDPSSIPQEPKFYGMYNVVHIDEKWFYMTKKNETYYMHPSEEEPLRTCQSKNFIEKVMFLVAMARPRFDEDGNETFSGKIGVFPFGNRQPAQRRSRNREAGTIEVKPIMSVKKETVRAYLIDKVVPAIQAKWPAEDSRNTIFIQQDNARTHINADDQEFQHAASQNGFDIRIICQPTNSPDLNVLDLGFFSAIQSLQHKECPRNVDELIHAVEKSFDEYSSKKVNHVFLSLQLCMREILRVEGSNRYKIPHINKDELERDGSLPQQIACDNSIVQGAMNLIA